jgi:hypothetical protein
MSSPVNKKDLSDLIKLHHKLSAPKKSEKCNQFKFQINNNDDLVKIINIIKEYNNIVPDDHNKASRMTVNQMVRCKNKKYSTKYYLCTSLIGTDVPFWNFISSETSYWPSKKIISPDDSIPHDDTNKYKTVWRHSEYDFKDIYSPFDNDHINV